MAGQPEQRIVIEGEADLVRARAAARTLTAALGFARRGQTLIIAAVTELAENVLQFAGRGEIALASVTDGARVGVTARARDDGPGIADVARALEDGYSSVDGLGLGLPGVRRIVDEFAIDSMVGIGTTVTVCKWRDDRRGERSAP